MKRSTALVFVVLAAACEKAPPPPAQTAAVAAVAAPAAPAAPVAEVVAPISTAGLMNPDAKKVDVAGPDSFMVHVITSKGTFDVKVHRDWAPKGADHLYFLLTNGFYDNVRFYRVLQGFMAQFGAAGDTAIAHRWGMRTIGADPVKHSNTRGTLTYAMGGSPDTRSTQLFINTVNNARLDEIGFAPLGEVTSGMAVVDSLYNQYGEGADSGGRGPAQGSIGTEGNAYLIREFPKLDYILTARVKEEWKKK